MKKSFSSRRVCAAAALTAVTLVGGGLAIAPAASASAAAGAHASATGHGPQVMRPDGNPQGCLDIPQTYGYYEEDPAGFAVICTGAYVGGLSNPVTAFGACTLAMYRYGVSMGVAGIACHAAVWG